ncbi:MAG: HTH domain-containing protein [Gammaproteobacteria bacterium]|nr:HTH domain-containing protein [Gammaproteobacteria bacterium]MCY4356476.1 HTH domain-containing protein [Gammaproteobacteria bacterium]
MKLAKTQEKILRQLKTRGPQTIKILANQLDITTMGVRQHIDELTQKGLVIKTGAARQNRGRPVHYWQLTDEGHASFPDRHNQAAVTLIHCLKDELGEHQLETLVGAAHESLHQRYRYELDLCEPELGTKLLRLAQLRTDDGFMAEIRLLPDGWLLIQNHCPQLAMANACQAYCHAELQLFRSLLGEQVSIQRTDHLLNDGRRCAYKIRQIEPKSVTF